MNGRYDNYTDIKYGDQIFMRTEEDNDSYDSWYELELEEEFLDDIEEAAAEEDEEE